MKTTNDHNADIIPALALCLAALCVPAFATLSDYTRGLIHGAILPALGLIVLATYKPTK